MSRILKVSQSDYRLQVQTGGNIILDTGVNAGTVTITGNLDVKGTTTTVESTTTTVKDNIIQLNVDPTYSGAGISSALGYQAGIEIQRGSKDSAQLVFSEQVVHYDAVTNGNVQGTFQLKTVNTTNLSTALSGIQLRTIANDGTADLTFDLQNATPVISIVNSTSSGNVTYESRVLNPNNIPNKKYVDDYVTTAILNASISQIRYPYSGTALSSVVTTATTIDFTVGLLTKMQISSGGVAINNLQLSNNTVTNSSGSNLVLTATNSNVEINAYLNLDNQASQPGNVTGKTKLYSLSSEGAGRTGIYFVNNTNYEANAYNADELVSKNRAVLLSILL